MRVLELALSLATFAIGARGGGGASATCTHRAADVARAAAHTCGILPVEEALRAVRMPAAAARRAGEMLAELGFGTALDLELLGGRESAAEVLAELKAGGLGPADRAKVRLLVGDREHSRRLTTDSTKHTGTGRRVLQSSGADSGMSTDTIAIVLSVLVGAAGYVVQAQTARRAERVQGEQAIEQNKAAQARQREHQIMTAQIERTHQAVDQCCRPVQNDLMASCTARTTFVQQIVSKLEASNPDTVEEMLSFSLTINDVARDGTVTSRSSGRLCWVPNPPRELTRVVGMAVAAAPSGAACAISGQDFYISMSKPYCFEMPSAILDTLAADPASEVADMFRAYVRHTMMPLFRRVTDTLRDYAAYMEPPSKDWLEKTYPEETWRSFSNAYFVQYWYCYTSSFERILSEWSDGNFKSMRPGSGQPMGGMVRTLTWSQERAETKQAELIGMTAVAELDHTHVFSRFEIG